MAFSRDHQAPTAGAAAMPARGDLVPTSAKVCFFSSSYFLFCFLFLFLFLFYIPISCSHSEPGLTGLERLLESDLTESKTSLVWKEM